MTFLSCIVQGSLLIEKAKKKIQKVVKNSEQVLKNFLSDTYPHQVLFAYLVFEKFFGSAETSELKVFSQTIIALKLAVY